jgi:UDPglucose 6-dehydrogenase
LPRKDAHTPRPRVGLVGLGYMGLATAAAFARHGLTTFGYDIVPARRAAVRAGSAPFHEEGLEDLIRAEVLSRRLIVVEDLAELVRSSEVIFLCLPTPARADGRIDLGPILAGAKELGAALARVDGFRVVVVKSTVVPGTSEEVVGPAVRAAAGKGADAIAIASNPEFLAEGRMVEDALRPDRIVVGASDPRARALLEAVYGVFDSPLVLLSPAGAEMAKYAANAFLALKVSFANELSRYAERVGIDIDDVVRGFGSDPRIGERFLRAGPGFGGSCFEKDVRALVRAAEDRGVHLPIAATIVPANDEQTRHALELIVSRTPAAPAEATVALLGLAFKEGTDDLRESRALPIVEHLASVGVLVRAHDPVAREKFRAWLAERPLAVQAHVTICDDVETALRGCDVAALQVPWPEYLAWPASWTRRMRRPVLVDLRRAFPPGRAASAGLEVVRLGDGHTTSASGARAGRAPPRGATRTRTTAGPGPRAPPRPPGLVGYG